MRQPSAQNLTPLRPEACREFLWMSRSGVLRGVICVLRFAERPPTPCHPQAGTLPPQAGEGRSEARHRGIARAVASNFSPCVLLGVLRGIADSPQGAQRPSGGEV